MAISSRLKIVGQILDGVSGPRDINTNERVKSNSLHWQIVQSLANGANTISVPNPGVAVGQPSGVIIIFDPTSTVTKTLKGIGGDTGIPLDPTGIIVLTFAAPLTTASFVITTSGADTDKTTTIIFF